jgi:hypothetical protein
MLRTALICAAAYLLPWTVLAVAVVAFVASASPR